MPLTSVARSFSFTVLEERNVRLAAGQGQLPEHAAQWYHGVLAYLKLTIERVVTLSPVIPYKCKLVPLGNCEAVEYLALIYRHAL
jgi:hypothetical protein